MDAIRHKRGDINPKTGKRFFGYYCSIHTGERGEIWKSEDDFIKIIQYKKDYNQKNRVAIKETRVAHCRKNREKRNQRLRYIRANFPEKTKIINKRNQEYLKRRYRKDPVFRMKRLMQTGLYRGVKLGFKKNHRTIEYLGCDFDYLKKYIQSLFKNGMSWDNYGDWEIDHKTPLSWFDLRDDSKCKEAWNYKNLQPLWRIENRAKSNRYAA